MMRRLKGQCFCSYTAKLRARRLNTTFFFLNWIVNDFQCCVSFNWITVLYTWNTTLYIYTYSSTNSFPYGLILNPEYSSCAIPNTCWLSLSSTNRKASEPRAPNYFRCSLLPSPVSCMCYVWPSPSTHEARGDHHNTGWQPRGHLWWKGLPDPHSKGAWGFLTESTMSRGSWVERGRAETAKSHTTVRPKPGHTGRDKATEGLWRQGALTGEEWGRFAVSNDHFGGSDLKGK